MVPVRYAVSVIVAVSLSGPALAQEPDAPGSGSGSTESIVIRIDPSVSDKGLRVVSPIEVAAAAEWPVRFRVTIVNLLEEEVFVTVEGIELTRLEYELERETPDGAMVEWLGSGATAAFLFPDNSGLLKRLHACDYQDGKARPCGCASGRLTGTFGEEGDTLDLRTVVGSKGTLTLPIRGYFRANGKAFSKEVEVPFTVVE